MSIPTMVCPECWGATEVRLFKVFSVPCAYCGSDGIVDDVQLSTHFWLSEMVHSPTAVALKISNAPSVEQIKKLQRLAVEGLEAVRQVLGVPIEITSGYRSPALNKALKSDPSSAHPDCNGSDLRLKGMSVGDALFKLEKSGLKFDQALYEPWLHYGHRRPLDNSQRRMVAVYLPGASGKRVLVPFDPSNPEVRKITGLTLG